MDRIEELRGSIPETILNKINEPLEIFKSEFICAINNSTGKEYAVEFKEELLDEKIDREAVETILTAISTLEIELRRILVEHIEMVGSRVDKLEYIILLIQSVSELFDLYTDMYINM